MIEKILERLREKFNYNSEQAEIYREGSDKDAYFREKEELYRDRANTYGVAISIVQEVAQEYTSTNTSTNQLDTSTIQQDTSTDGWIPVEDRLPEVGKKVLVFDALDGMSVEELGKNDEFIWSVLAWRELPNPYQPKGE